MKRLERKTKRLVVRPLRAADYAAWREASLARGAARNRWDRAAKTEADLTRAKFAEYLRKQRDLRERDAFYDFGVFERATGAWVGTTSVMDVLRSVSQTAFLAYFINNPHWGKGYGKEAAAAAIDIAFRDLKLHRVEAGVEPTNRRSILLARSLGLRKEGLKKRIVFLRGRWNDLVMYSATCEDFGIKWAGEAKPTNPR